MVVKTLPNALRRRSHSTRGRTARPPDQDTARPANPETGSGTSAVEENVEAIRRWEQAALHSRSRAERLSDAIAWAAASGPVLVAHVGWFMVWIAANLGLIPFIPVFDPFPFPFLTVTASLEAIFLALIVLASQNRLARQSDKRAHLDLQIDLLAEREMTTVLRMLQDIAAHLNVSSTVTPGEIRELANKTDLHRLTTDVEEMPDADRAPVRQER